MTFGHLGNLLEDAEYLNYHIQLLLHRWLYRDLSSRVLATASADVLDAIYLRFPHPLLPADLRYNPQFINRWLHHNMTDNENDSQSSVINQMISNQLKLAGISFPTKLSWTSRCNNNGDEYDDYNQ